MTRRMRVFAANDPTYVLDEGDVFGTSLGKVMYLEHGDGSVRAWSVNLPMQEVSEPDYALELRDDRRLRKAGWQVFQPGELYLRWIFGPSGQVLKVIPASLHNALCESRVGTPQDTTPQVLGCVKCGFFYPKACCGRHDGERGVCAAPGPSSLGYCCGDCAARLFAAGDRS